tara:strand:+ start:2299 stop:2685 length:387 start_codon:yes stop_codon:yes gene_type:complete
MSNKVFLNRSHRLPILIIVLGASLIPFEVPYLFSILICSFGIFLLAQSFTLRIELADDDFVVWQLGKELRRFPYKNWIAWRIILPGLPGFFYFREEASPHLLPIIFDHVELRNQLQKKVGDLEIPNKD